MGVTVNPISGGGGGSATTNASELTSGTLANARLDSGQDVSNLADGSVSNTEFQYLDGVTSDIQTQIDGISGGFWDYTSLQTLDSSTTSSTSYGAPKFSITLPAAGAYPLETYYVRAVIFLDNNNTASVGYKFKIRHNGGCDFGTFNGEVKDTSYSKKVVSTATSDLIEFTETTQVLNKGSVVVVEGAFQPSGVSSYNLEFHLTQGTSSANAVYIRKGSYVTVKRV